MYLNTELVMNGPRYSIHGTGTSARALREKWQRGHRNHAITCRRPDDPSKPKNQMELFSI
jgi:hypothetical protein